MSLYIPINQPGKKVLDKIIIFAQVIGEKHLWSILVGGYSKLKGHFTPFVSLRGIFIKKCWNQECSDEILG